MAARIGREIRSTTLPMASLTLRFAPRLAFGVFLLSVSCGRFTQTRQCRALIARVNPALDEIARLTHDKTDKATYLAAAARYEQLSIELGPLQFSNQQMAKDVAEYAGILHSTGIVLKSLALAVDGHNASEIERISRELERLDGREHVSITKMDTWCQPGA
ncbi:MAG TPA: hypothetical protein VGI10_00520 [Polyangiaceae bacterium]